jgi:hypothetical protein
MSDTQQRPEQHYGYYSSNLERLITPTHMAKRVSVYPNGHEVGSVSLAELPSSSFELRRSFETTKSTKKTENNSENFSEEATYVSQS